MQTVTRREFAVESRSIIYFCDSQYPFYVFITSCLNPTETERSSLVQAREQGRTDVLPPVPRRLMSRIILGFGSNFSPSKTRFMGSFEPCDPFKLYSVSRGDGSEPISAHVELLLLLLLLLLNRLAECR